MGTSIVNQSNLAVNKNVLDIYNGEKYSHKYDSLKKQLVESGKSLDQIMNQDVSELVSRVNEKLELISDEKLTTNHPIIRLPNILHTSADRNRFIQITDDKYLITVFQSVSMNSTSYHKLTIFEYDRVSNTINLMFKSTNMTSENIDYIKSHIAWDILYDPNNEKYELYWINSSNHIVSSIIDVETKSLTKYNYVVQDVVEKKERLVVAINSKGDRVIFTSKNTSNSKSESTLYAKINNTDSWTLVTVKPNTTSYDDSLAYGRIIVVNDEFYMSYTNKANLVYICRATIKNKTVSITVVKLITASKPNEYKNIYQVPRYLSETDKNQVQIVIMEESNKSPVVVNASTEINIQYTVMSSLSSEINSSCYFSFYNSKGYIIRPTRFSVNNGTSWVTLLFKNPNDHSYLPFSVESTKMVLTKLNYQSVLLDVDALTDFTKPISMK